MDPNRYRFLQTLQSIGALFVVVGLMTLAAGAWQYRAGRAIATWPATAGQVIANDLVPVEQRGRSVTVVEAVRVVYRYAVDGQTYESDRVSLDTQPARADRAEGQRRRAAYPVGAAVSVYYDPADPARSVLERAPRIGALLAGATLAALGLLVLLAWRGMASRERPASDGRPPSAASS